MLVVSAVVNTPIRSAALPAQQEPVQPRPPPGHVLRARRAPCAIRGVRRARPMVRRRGPVAWRPPRRGRVPDRTRHRRLDRLDGPAEPRPAPANFDGGGIPELLLRNIVDGHWAAHDGIPAAPELRRLPGLTADFAFRLGGLGGFDGDGADEVLLRHAKGDQWIYYALADGRAPCCARRKPPGTGTGGWPSRLRVRSCAPTGECRKNPGPLAPSAMSAVASVPSRTSHRDTWPAIPLI